MGIVAFRECKRKVASVAEKIQEKQGFETHAFCQGLNLTIDQIPAAAGGAFGSEAVGMGVTVLLSLVRSVLLYPRRRHC